MTRGGAIPTEPEELQHARAQFLTRAADAADRGHPIPCAGRDEWVSEDAAEQEWAGHQCGRCPVLARCRALALAWPAHTAGAVYGGLTTAERKKLTKEAS